MCGTHPAMTPFQVLADRFGMSGDELADLCAESAMALCQAGIPIDADQLAMGYTLALLDIDAGRLRLAA